MYRAEVDLYERRDALPRAWIVHTVEAAPRASKERISRLADESFDPRARAMVEGPLPDVAPTSEPSTVDFERDDAQVVTLRARTATPGLLVLSDAWYAAWVATVDGREVPIARTDACMRGVVVPAGEHRVEFRYRDVPFRVGAGLFVAGSAVIAALLRRRRNDRPA